MPFDASRTPPTIADIFRAGRALIERPECLARGTPGDGYTTYCSVAALVHATIDLGRTVDPEVVRAFLLAALPAGIHGTVEYSDTATHADVLAWWDRAIALAERRS